MASVTNQVSSAIRARAVTPTDATALALGDCRALYIGTAGNVAVILSNDTAAVVFVGVAAGQILPLMVHSVQATNTTASNIVALY